MTKLMKDVFDLDDLTYELDPFSERSKYTVFSGKKAVFAAHYEEYCESAITAIKSHDSLTEQNKQLVEALESVINIINEVYMPDCDENISHEHFEEISAVRKAMINPMEILAKHKEQI